MDPKQKNPAVIEKGTACPSKQSFTDVLRKWHDQTDERVIGPSAPRGQTAWLWAEVGGDRLHLNADTERTGVSEYLEFADRYGEELAWHVRANQNGTKINKICFGPNETVIPGFYLYLQTPWNAEGTIGDSKTKTASIPYRQPNSTFPQGVTAKSIPSQHQSASTDIQMLQRGRDTLTWIDLSSLRLAGRDWQMTPCQLPLEVEKSLISIEMNESGGCRHATGIEVGGSPEIARIAITQRRENNGIGCRVMAAAIERLTSHYGSVDRVPEQIFIQTRPGSTFGRGGSLLMLQAFANPADRQSIWGRYSWSHIPTHTGETPKEYESRAVESLRSIYEGYKPLPSSDVFLPGVLSQPDGLFASADRSQLLIIEAKQKRPDFEEGAAQIILYYLRAKQCGAWLVHLRLVTSESQPTRGYEIWREWMQPPKKLTVFVAEAK